MINHFVLSFQRILFIILVAILSVEPGYAQFAGTSHLESNAAKGVSSFAPLFEGLGRLIHDRAEAQNGTAPAWDSGQQRYRSSLLSYLYHPEIPAAGYRKIKLIEANKRYGFGSAGDFKTEAYRKQAEEAVSRRDSRNAPVYIFDSLGWLRAIRQEQMNPRYEAYTETVDSLFYDFRNDGTASLRWQQLQHNSGRGYASTSKCGSLPSFFQLYVRKQVTAELDAYGTIRSLRQRTDEQWDTCTAGGPQFLNQSMEYDAEGRLTRITGREGKEDSVQYERTFRYTPLSWADFNRRIAFSDTFAPLREPLVQHWLQDINGLKCLEYQESGVTFKHHNRDSPVVWNASSSFVFLNARNQVVASIPGKGYEDISFLIRETEGKTGTPLLFQQQIPKMQPTTESGIVCKPLALKSSVVYKNEQWPEGTDTLKVSLAGSVAQELKPTYYNTTVVSSPEFVPAIPKGIQYQVKSAALINKQRLLHYLWLPEKTYVLLYE